MKSKKLVNFVGSFSLAVALTACGPFSPERKTPVSGDGPGYEGLVALFHEFRDYQRPRMNAGVPDYSLEAMREQRRRLPEFQARLKAFDISGWPISERVDYEIVRAEMNGLDFDHRVLRPWARDPAFYAVITTSEPDVPAREGPEIHGVLDLFRYAFPLEEPQAAEVRAKLEAVLGILDQARRNLTEGGKDLWSLGILQKKREAEVLARLAGRLSGSHPALVPAAERAREAVSDFMGFLRGREIFTVADYMGLNNEARSLLPPDRWDFFTRVLYLDQLPLVCHQVHWLEKQREARNTHPIRGVPLLYNIWDSRAEGFATAFEETMLQAGLMDKNPRARELVYILVAFRAARAMGDLKMHSREWTFEEAMDFGAQATPRGWVNPRGDVIRTDISIYLRQPGYGTSYVYGKLMFERLVSDVARQKGDAFTLKGFLDEYFGYGLIPASLIRWEMTGLDDEMRLLGR